MEEIWRKIKRFEGFYEVSNLGRVRSLPRKHSPGLNILKPLYHSGGYSVIDLRKPHEKKKHFLAHRLVAIAFIPNPQSKPDVNHKDSNRKNNKVDNLEWATRKENLHHAHLKDRMVWNKKTRTISEEQVREIKNRYKAGEKQNKMAKEFKVSRSWICIIINNRK